MSLFSEANPKQQMAALRRYEAIVIAQMLVEEGVMLMIARSAVASRMTFHGFPCNDASIARWQAQVDGLPRHSWLDALTSTYVGRVFMDIPAAAWDAYMVLLQSGKHSRPSAYAALLRRFGSSLPCRKTFDRRLKRFFPDTHARFLGARRQS